MGIREIAVRSLAALTRRVHPKGTFHLVRRVHSWERRAWSVEDVVPFEKRMKVRASTASFVEWIAYFFGEYEPEIAALIRRSIRHGHAAIDVGANVGYLTLVMAEASRGGRVLACEPHPEMFERLLRNLELNQFSNVVTRRIAISDKPGTATLFLPNPDTQSNLSTASLQQNDEFLGDARSVEVEVVTLDQLVSAEGIDNVDVIKIDVEGYEGPALQGATEVLSRDRPTLIFEYRRRYWEKVGYTFDRVRDRLAEIGYEKFLNITPKGPEPISAVTPEDMNVLVVGEALRI